VINSGKPGATALLLIDLQNDFIHPDGAYARGGQSVPVIAALPRLLSPLARAVQQSGGMVIVSQFTLVTGRGGEPIISPHLKQLRPFLQRGDFAPGSWGQSVVEELEPVDAIIEKVSYSAFYMTRLEWLLRKCAIDSLIVGGIVTNGGVASTVRDAHARDFPVTLLTDGCAAFSQQVHEAAVEGLRPVAEMSSIDREVVRLQGLRE
jgi:nicotinamidase-related amidase